MSRIIFIGNYPPPFSGQSIAFKTLVDGYGNQFNDYCVINTIEKPNKRDSFSRILDYVSVIFKLLFLLIFKKTEIVYHIVSSHKKGFIRDFVVINLSSLFGKKIILHSHNGNYDQFYDLSSKRMQKSIFKTINKASTIVLLSEKLRNTFYFIKNKDKFVFVNNGLPIDRPINLKKSKENKFSILYLSNLIESKGYLDVIESVILLKKMNLLSKFHFHFAGDFMLNNSQDKSYTSIKEAKNLFFNLIKDNDLTNNVSYHGIIQGEKKNNLLQNADVFLLPTYYNVEAQPLTIIEALAYGCAIFSTNYRGIPEMLINDYNGKFIESKSPYSIAANLKGLNRENIQKYSKNSIDLFDKSFTKEKHIHNMIKKI
ncbi:MAG: glycosyltransferase family 4 protein [Polaribacter sp.]|jgi:glycosyltransferase involved in cell wall biosynthesis|nr:glycosyltransferase family 4 protein [Polaribacter sp.]